MHHKKPAPVFLAAILSLGTLIALSACYPFVKKAPAIQQIFTESTDVAFRMDLSEVPIDWDAFEAKKESLKSMANETNEFTAIVQEFQLDPREIITIAGCSYELAEYLALDEENRDGPPEYVVAIDVDRKIPVDMLVTELNNNKKLKVTATITGKEEGFDLVKISDASGAYTFRLALFTSSRSQIRIGTETSVMKSLTNPLDYNLVREDMLRPEGQSWAYLKVPEELNENLSEFETILPFEPGVLVSGFKTLVYSLEATETSLESTFSLEFDTEEQANTAFSYLQLGLNFALKPYLRKQTRGESIHFIRSIKNNNVGDLVKLSCSINGEDIDALQNLIDEDNIPPILLPFLDLIKKP